jgi:RNA polymerase sigma-70 factor (ECF subfamily)
MFPSNGAVEGAAARSVPVSSTFATTHWSLVLTAGGDSPGSVAALEQLCRTYWYPIYAFIRRSGHSSHEAQDFTQGFFAELFRKNYFRAADRERGKFRTFLLTALRHYLAHEWEKGQAAKRGGGVASVSWDGETAEDWYQHEPIAALASPERMYDRTWALRVFEYGLERLRLECSEQDKEPQFDKLKSYLTQEPDPGAYAEVGAALGLSPNAVAVAVHRLRQRYAALVRAVVEETVAKPEQVDDELSYLIGLVCA